ncbi:MAG: UDP-N-acetyl-D-glucosamine 2-epimerase, UDP-hydrolyzing [Anaerocolumna sp.]|jgi:GDP/UDP-N,N'-diacetylbacillosamine 2-epimerase (hydrolysing)|nr:UDP-N-acetyl-D-glucosamine 2-epimerase, UDP-hydrolyzing [Anaerocolumna sp.]
MKKVCIVTGSRAEYGILQPLIYKLSKDEEIELQIIATGMHLSPEFGLTYKQIENDGYKINEKIETVLSSDTTVGISKAIGLGLISFAEVYQRLNPDLIIILGDRYEIFAAASAAMVSKIPIAHLHGGELTEGAIDEAIRHAITKMSYLHFTSTEVYRQRVIQLGEAPERVHNVGALGVENVKKMKLLTKDILEERLQFKFDKKVALITFHPVTLEDRTSQEQFQVLLEAVDYFMDLKIIFTKANADADGRIINSMIDKYVKRHADRCVAFTSMGQEKYLSALQYSSIVIGNSSSGIIEVPSFNIPTVNIGDRQQGRIKSKSVIDCGVKVIQIKQAIESGLSKQNKVFQLKNINPYEKENTTEQIILHIKKFLKQTHITFKKKFYDLEQ